MRARTGRWPGAALLAIGLPTAGAATATSRLSSAPGIQVASFKVEAGTVYEDVPDGMAPGETVSATVTEEKQLSIEADLTASAGAGPR